MRPSPRGPAAGVPLPHDSTAPRVARSLVEGELTATGAGPDQREVARLLTSELVTNAIRYGLPPLYLGVALYLGVGTAGDRLRVQVWDGSPAMPVVSRPPPAKEGGRGLLLLDLLATAWGAEPDGTGKNVWFELALALPPHDVDRVRADGA